MRFFLMMGAVAMIAACGGGSPAVTGEISEACIAADRRAATPELCYCVQQVANQTLSNSAQSRAAGFFEEPQLAQATRQSDSFRDERFWDRYKSFSDLATQICQPIDV